MKRLLAWLTLSACAAATCVPYTAAKKYVGDEVCVTGKVLKVGRSPRSGTQFLNFCDDYKNCPFTVVVFAKDAQHVGDVTALQGQEIKLYGKVREYKGQAEIILSDVRQLKGEKIKLPPAPKNFDVANQGHYSAGTFSEPRRKKSRSRQKPHGPTTTEPPEDPPGN